MCASLAARCIRTTLFMYASECLCQAHYIPFATTISAPRLPTAALSRDQKSRQQHAPPDLMATRVASASRPVATPARAVLFCLPTWRFHRRIRHQPCVFNQHRPIRHRAHASIVEPGCLPGKPRVQPYQAFGSLVPTEATRLNRTELYVRPFDHLANGSGGDRRATKWEPYGQVKSLVSFTQPCIDASGGRKSGRGKGVGSWVCMYLGQSSSKHRIGEPSSWPCNYPSARREEGLACWWEIHGFYCSRDSPRVLSAGDKLRFLAGRPENLGGPISIAMSLLGQGEGGFDLFDRTGAPEAIAYTASCLSEHLPRPLFCSGSAPAWFFNGGKWLSGCVMSSQLVRMPCLAEPGHS